MEQFFQKHFYRSTIARHKLDVHQMGLMNNLVFQIRCLVGVAINYSEQMGDLWVKVDVFSFIKVNGVKLLKKAPSNR